MLTPDCLLARREQAHKPTSQLQAALAEIERLQRELAAATSGKDHLRFCSKLGMTRYLDMVNFRGVSHELAHSHTHWIGEQPPRTPPAPLPVAFASGSAFYTTDRAQTLQPPQPHYHASDGGCDANLFGSGIFDRVF